MPRNMPRTFIVPLKLIAPLLDVLRVQAGHVQKHASADCWRTAAGGR